MKPLVRTLSACVALSLSLSVASADRNTSTRSERSGARELYERATKAYNLQAFSTALDLFKQAYELRPDPVLLFNIAQCQRQMGGYEVASKSYRAYLNELPKASNREEVKLAIKAMDDAAREARAKEPPMGTQPLSEGHDKLVESPPPPPPPDRPWYKNGAGWGVLAAGVAVAAVGGGLAAYGEQQRSAESTLPSLPQRNSAADAAATFRPTGYALIGVGGAALVTGVIWLAVGSRSSKHASLRPSHGGFQVAW